MYTKMEGVKVKSTVWKECTSPDNDNGKVHITYRFSELELQYLGLNGDVKTRDLKLYVPVTVERSMLPLIIAVHYEIPEGYKILFGYLKSGYAVLSPANVPQEHLQNLSGDNLLFNIGMVDLARRLDFVDKDRVIIRGGSAGGYIALILSAIHMGVLCTYSMYGITNMLYEQKYLSWNNRFNEEYEATVPEGKKSDLSHYPMPYIKLAYDLIGDTDRFIGMNDGNGEKWCRYSPVFYLKEMIHPILIYHSSADIMVPINQLTERYFHRKNENDLPGAFKDKLENFIDESGKDAVLNTPMADMINSDDMEVFILTYDTPSIRINQDKQFNINIFDEDGKSGACAHFKNQIYGENETELEYVKQYLGKKAHMTNRITFEKMKAIALRYNGTLPVLEPLNLYKKACRPGIFGSLSSDRLDILSGIALYLGMDTNAEEYGKISVYSVENLEIFEKLYWEMENDLKFIEKDVESVGLDIGGDLPEKLAGLIRYYYEQCGRVKMD